MEHKKGFPMGCSTLPTGICISNEETRRAWVSLGPETHWARSLAHLFSIATPHSLLISPLPFTAAVDTLLQLHH